MREHWRRHTARTDSARYNRAGAAFPCAHLSQSAGDMRAAMTAAETRNESPADPLRLSSVSFTPL